MGFNGPPLLVQFPINLGNKGNKLHDYFTLTCVAYLSG